MKRCAILLPTIGVLALSLSLPVRAEDRVVDYSKYGDYAKYGTVKDVPGACSYDAIAKKHYAGRTLRVIAHAVPVLGEPADLHAKQFADLTGAKVDVVHISFGDLFQRIMIPFQTNQDA